MAQKIINKAKYVNQYRNKSLVQFIYENKKTQPKQ